MVRGLVFLIVSVALMLALPVGADSWKGESGHSYRGGKHKQKHKHKRKHREKYVYEVEYEYDGRHARGGPPPWAPAHGYRRAHERDRHEYRDHRHEYRERYEYRERQPQVTIHVEPAPKVHTTAEVEFEADSQRIGIDAGKCDRKAVGAVVGGLMGGIIGNKVSARKDKTFGTLAGALIGAVVGSEIGRNMDDADAHCTNQALERARDGQAVTWDNPNTGHKYSVTPTDTYRRDDGTYCREYKTTVKAQQQDGKSYTQEACRNSDGVWEKQS